ncbi:MAG TPA: hypothetical protein VN784_04970 [Candidatus Limnocylindrales bacterium]|nr:hypothetical protein [Candidatus Limnocylindrales bacterium]
MNRIPAEARIEVVRTVERQGRACSPSEPRRDRDIAPYQQTVIVPPAEVREKFKRVKPLKEISVEQRGWTLDVLNAGNGNGSVLDIGTWGIPTEARILVVTESRIAPAAEVRDRFKRVKPLKEISVTQRGWTLDVLNAIRRLGKTEFTTMDAYAFTRELEKLHPDNRHVRDKIRQQLQVLRDAGLLIHVGRGEWRLP